MDGRTQLPHSAHYRIEGGQPLRGDIAVLGAKNALNKQLVATLLTREPCVLRGIPRIAEVDTILKMLTQVGTQHDWLDESTLRLQTEEIQSVNVSQEYSGFNRIPILLLSPLLHRTGQASVPIMGGCRIGPRPVDFHLAALEQMGADVTASDCGFIARGRLRGCQISLPYPSVGATETAILAAVLAVGTTTISNAAIEPEVIDTILFLQKMGAQISIGVNRQLTIEGVQEVHGTTHAPVPDRIEAASFAVAAVATDGEICVRNARQEHMTTFLNALRKAGGGFRVEDNGITFFREQSELRPQHLETDVHPGFMTDWQQPFAVLMTQASGVSVIHETVYENRFGYTRALIEMGADIELSDFCMGRAECRFRGRGHAHSAIIRGGTTLHGADIAIPDLRAGFAYIVAALVADGMSRVTGLEYLERGYSDVPARLRSIGAQITDSRQIDSRAA